MRKKKLTDTRQLAGSTNRPNIRLKTEVATKVHYIGVLHGLMYRDSNGNTYQGLLAFNFKEVNTKSK